MFPGTVHKDGTRVVHVSKSTVPAGTYVIVEQKTWDALVDRLADPTVSLVLPKWGEMG